jgi:hypothetical protein
VAGRNLAAMHPIEAAALIGVGGSVIVAVVAYIATTLATRWTLAAERERRIWEKKSAAYELTLGELLNRQVKRFKAQRGDPDMEMVKAYLAARESPGWIQAEAMLVAYAPQPVIDALEDSRLAYIQAARGTDRLQESKGSVSSPDEGLAAFRELMEAVVEADKKDQALANTVRRELGLAAVRLPLPSAPDIS